MKKIFILLGGLFYGIGLSAQTKVLTFQDALQLAIQQNYGVRRAQNNIESAHLDVIGNKNLFLPNATFLGGYNFQAGNNLLIASTPTVVGSTISGLNLQLNSSYVLLDGSARKYQLLASQKTEEATGSQLKFTRQQLVNDLSLAFLQLSLDRKLIDIAYQNWQLSRQRDSLLTDLVKAGLRLPSDLYQQQAQTRSDEQQLIANRNQLQSHKIYLIRRLNLPAENYDFAEIPDLPITNFPTQDLFTNAYNKRYDLLTLRHLEEATNLKTTQIEAATKPQVVASAGLLTNSKYLLHQNVNGSDVLINYPQSNFVSQLGNQINGYLGVSMVWNIFDRYQTKTAVAKNRIEVLNRQLDIQDRQDQIRAEITQALTDYETARQQFTTSQAQVAAAQAAFDLQQGRFQNGLATLIDLFTAQNALISAQAISVRSQIQVRYQQQLIQFYAGEGQE